MKWAIMASFLVGTTILVLLEMSGRGTPAEPGHPTAAGEGRSTDGPGEASIRGLGFVEPASETRKLTSKVDGVIARCAAEIGKAYKKGEVLFELDGCSQLAALAVAEADWQFVAAEREKVASGIHPHLITSARQKVETLRERLEYWSREHDRYRVLASRGSVSGSEHAKAETEFQQHQTELRGAEADLLHLQENVRPEDLKLADARLKAAAARLGQAKQRYEDTILRAPFDGSVLEVLKREGEGVTTSDPDPIAVFGDIRRFRVRAEVDERFVDALRVGQRAIVFGRGLGDRRFDGRLALIKPIMGKKTVFARSATERKDLDVIQVIVELPDDFNAPVGLEVDVKIEGPSRERSITTSPR